MQTKYLLVALILVFIHSACAQEPKMASIFNEIFTGPDTAGYDSWLTAMKKWRTDEQRELNYTGDTNLNPELGRAKRTITQAQVLVHDLYSPVDADTFPGGSSTFGITDMTRNVWQWADDNYDIHTRFAIPKGGGRYRPTISLWYFLQADELNKYGKYLLMLPGTDCAGMIGFRCMAHR